MQSTLDSAYNEKKYAEILLCYRQLFVKGNVFIGEWGIFGAEVFLCYSQFFIKGNFIRGRVECTYFENQSPYVAHLQNTATQVEHLSTRTDPSTIKLFNQEQAIQRDTNALISRFSNL